MVWCVRLPFVVLLLAGLSAHGNAIAQPGPIFFDGFESQPANDSGMLVSGSGLTATATTCDPNDPAVQDCFFGRDALAASGGLAKVGGSTPNAGIDNGFDYTKLCNSGEAAGTGSCPADPALGSGPDDWACNRDNVTGLLWAVKTDDGGIRDKDWTYTWYDDASPDGNPGTIGPYDTCQMPLVGTACMTQNFVAVVNAAGLCGHADWRLPSVAELMSLIDFGRSELSIDPTWFPNAVNANAYFDVYWAGMAYADTSGDNDAAWIVSFTMGRVSQQTRSTGNSVRLVRGGR